ncbi:hypothetical protein N7457_007428 [Penicillium paradoxum]|uniref:uncharacterized protein n=1 Tax=Penicillium paradoxum TaxID=176176 RepID=UPI0025487E12|nr:uncharacterized protein N7457_007428 [Penicillium paradoxum]KAJ5779708.1 hypothetical protein N7457_007428 [Penicillium paradoxum]
MEDGTNPAEDLKKKKKASFRRKLREAGIEVPPVVPRQRDSALPPKVKRKRAYSRAGRKRANKRKKAAAASEETTEPGPEASVTPDASPVTSPVASPVVEPVALPVASPVASSVASSAALPVASSVALPVASPVVSPVPSLSANVISQPEVPAENVDKQNEEAADDEKVVWDPIDPLGLFDELEGPLNWPSEDLWD